MCLAFFCRTQTLMFARYLSLCLTLLLFSKISLASSMRCGQNVIQQGATKLEVLKHCGEPDMKDQISGYEDINTEIWYYDRDPTGFLYILTFRASRLVKIEVRQS